VTVAQVLIDEGWA